jgi:catechol 2,3-dioxygenase-like lactoylglutathione lyase family enzyme
MRVLGLVWLGVATERYDDTVRFFRDVLGLRVEFEHERTVEFSAERDDRVHVFAPGHPYFDVFRARTSAPVALFEVDDLDAARAELDAAGDRARRRARAGFGLAVVLLPRPGRESVLAGRANRRVVAGHVCPGHVRGTVPGTGPAQKCDRTRKAAANPQRLFGPVRGTVPVREV